MPRVVDKSNVDPKAWEQAVAREAVLRPIALSGRVSPDEVAAACKQLGMGRAWLYRLLRRYGGLAGEGRPGRRRSPSCSAVRAGSGPACGRANAGATPWNR